MRKACKEQHPDAEGEYKGHVHICSVNNFPTAAGLASSAAGYACLGKSSWQYVSPFRLAMIAEHAHR